MRASQVSHCSMIPDFSIIDGPSCYQVSPKVGGYQWTKYSMALLTKWELDLKLLSVLATDDGRSNRLIRHLPKIQLICQFMDPRLPKGPLEIGNCGICHQILLKR